MEGSDGHRIGDVAYLPRGRGARSVSNPLEYLSSGRSARAVRPPTVEVFLRRTGRPGKSLSGPEAVGSYLRGMGDLDREVMVALLLDSRHRVIGVEEVARGHLGGVEVSPRELFKSASLSNAAAMILAHNHPSGDPAPSAEDVALTDRMRSAGDLLGIKVLDHVIVGEDQVHSLMSRQTVDLPRPHTSAGDTPTEANPVPWLWIAAGAAVVALLVLAGKKAVSYLAGGKLSLLSRFGQIRKPTGMIPWWRRHTGTDLAMPAGTPIRALLDGVVARSNVSITDKSRGRGYGNIIVVRHERKGEKFRTVYAHLQERLVKEGDVVKAGQVIAKSGRSGIVDKNVPDHLHLEVAQGWDKAIIPPSKGGAVREDPLRFMAQRGIALAPGMAASSNWYGEIAVMTTELVKAPA